MRQDGVEPGEDEARIEALLHELTLEEKAGLTVGQDTWTTRPVERLGIPSIWLADGPTGLRKARSATDIGLGQSLPATCFPTASALAATWNVELLAEVGQALGREAQAQGVQVLLGPGVNLKRSPLCGRNFEYYSEDPILTGELAGALIEGVQSEGVGTSVKHLVANEQESGRMYVDSQVDERTLRELYLRPFELAVEKAGPWTLMAAYNRLNGTYCCENTHLLHEIVEVEWQYKGIVMSDWGAVDERVDGVEAGLHLQMPAGATVQAVAAAVREGRLAESRLDEIVRALLRCILRADALRRPGATVDFAAHHLLARRAAGEAIVLLKNEGDILPLTATDLTEIAVIGAFAKEPRYQGAGSSQVVPTQIDTAYDELVKLAGPTATVTYAAGYGAGALPDVGLLREAQTVAQNARAAVVFVGLPASFEAEGADRAHMNLPEAQNALIAAVLDVQPEVVVVLINGSAVTMPWAARVPAILEAWLGGQAGGGAIADVLTGHVNPSGKLAETFPLRLEDTPSFLNFPGDGEGHVLFGEGLYTGYRWYDRRRIAPQFPFGHGLSYTTFEYRSLLLDKHSMNDADTLTVSLNVHNTGTCDGMEIVQLYVHERWPRLPRPEKELKAFAKVSLRPGEDTTVTFTLGERDFAFFDPRAGCWTVTTGEFDILVGASALDIRLSEIVTVETTRQIPVHLDRHSPIRDWLATPTGRTRLMPALDALRRQLGVGAGAELPGSQDDDVLLGFFYDMPVVKLATFGVLDDAALSDLVSSVNA